MIKSMLDKNKKYSTRDKKKQELYRSFSSTGIMYRRLKRFMFIFLWVLTIQIVSGGKRAMDIVVSLTIIIFLSPVLGIILLLCLGKVVVIQRTLKAGQWCEPFNEYSFADLNGLAGFILKKTGLIRIPILFNVIKGDISFVGPRILCPGNLSPRERDVRIRYRMKPGIISIGWIRRRANIDYNSEIESDLEYVHKHEVFSDIGILLRAIPALLYGKVVVSARDKVTILGISVTNKTMTEAVDMIMEQLYENALCQVCFVNADCVNIACVDNEYFKLLGDVDDTELRKIVFADGIGMKLAGKLLNKDIKQNVNGTDFFPRICQALSGSGKGIYLFGGRAGVAEAVSDRLKRDYPGLKICGYRHGYFSQNEEEKIVHEILKSGADLIFVAFGAPYQDKWIHKYLCSTGAKVGIGVGGLFDFYSGRIKRAPDWLREIGMEWVYRFCQEPGRMWKRYFVGNVIFLIRVLREQGAGIKKQ